MYFEQMLIAIGAIGAFLFLLAIAYLIKSHRKSKMFKRMLKEETEQLTTFSTTILSTRTELNNISETQIGLDLTVADTPGYEVTLPDEGVLYVNMPNLMPLNSTVTALDGHYTLLGKIGGGGQGNIYWARKNNTGNHWIVKHIPWSVSKLTNEADILGKFNHPGLPTIIDMFQDENGLYLVENYLEGKDMEDVLKDTNRINAFVLLDWADQMSQVLKHLHNMQPQPIYHMDLKPANIMVSPYGNKLTLIDFGISRSQTDIDTAKGGTPAYAAPEQLQKMSNGRNKETVEKSIKSRFGSLPEASAEWGMDARTDIYSLGIILFEAAVGARPTHKNMDVLKEYLSKDFCNIIYKCLAIDPKNRYQSVDELIADIDKQKNQKVEMNSTFLMRRVAQVAAGLALAVSVSGFTYGGQMWRLEAQASMHITPQVAVVSMQQHSDIRVYRTLPGESTGRYIDARDISWDITANPIAAIDGNRVVGLNIGQTIISGNYRNTPVSLHVHVVENNQYNININQRYRAGNIVSLYAGTVNRAFVDGALSEAEFVSIESIDAKGETIFIADSSRFRQISNNIVETNRNIPPHQTPYIIRTNNQDLYVLTHSWTQLIGGEENLVFVLFRYNDNGIETLFDANPNHVTVYDFDVAPNGDVYFIMHNLILDVVYLYIIENNHPTVLKELPSGIRTLAIGQSRIYLADETRGVIMYYENGSLTYLAGLSGELAIIDGSAPNFFRPQNIRYYNGNLYVWDFNVLRKLYLEDGAVVESVSIAGQAVSQTPVADANFAQPKPAETMIFPHGRLVDFVHVNNGILISDPMHGVIWHVTENES